MRVDRILVLTAWLNLEMFLLGAFTIVFAEAFATTAAARLRMGRVTIFADALVAFELFFLVLFAI